MEKHKSPNAKEILNIYRKARERKESREVSSENNKDKIKNHKALLLEQLKKHVENPETATRLESFAAMKRDSAVLETYYIPSYRKEGSERVLAVPLEKTYICSPDEDINRDSTPICLLLQGVYNKDTQTNNTSILPEQKTVIDDLNAEYNESGFSFATSVRLDEKYVVGRRIYNQYQEKNILAKKIVVEIIWDPEGYQKRLSAIKKNRSAESYTKPRRRVMKESIGASSTALGTTESLLGDIPEEDVYDDAEDEETK
jgi:hypothetical protein